MDSLLPELGAFHDVGNGVFEAMTHVFSLSFSVGSAEDATSFRRVFPVQILFILLEREKQFEDVVVIVVVDIFS